MKRLSDIVQRNVLVEEVENIIGDFSLILDVGFYVEAYFSPKGAQGYSLWFYIDKELSYRELLFYLSEGSIKDGTLTLTIIPCEDDWFEIERAKSIPISVEIDKRRGSIA